MSITFEYCSLSYLNQWLSWDMKFFEVLNGRDRHEKLKTLKEAATFYKVARNLPKAYDEQKGYKRYEPLLDVLETIKIKTKDSFNLISTINEFNKKISAAYGGRNTLSLSTKMLWLKYRNPFIIYDSRAREALGSRDGDLEDYFYRWQEAYKANAEEVKRVCKKLPDLYKYTSEKTTKKYIKSIIDEQWFRDRVFDIYLWNEGAEI